MRAKCGKQPAVFLPEEEDCESVLLTAGCQKEMQTYSGLSRTHTTCEVYLKTFLKLLLWSSWLFFLLKKEVARMYVWLNVFIGLLPIIELLVTILNYSVPKRRKSVAFSGTVAKKHYIWTNLHPHILDLGMTFSESNLFYKTKKFTFVYVFCTFIGVQ